MISSLLFNSLLKTYNSQQSNVIRIVDKWIDTLNADLSFIEWPKSAVEKDNGLENELWL